jgi:hypothetical protein
MHNCEGVRGSKSSLILWFPLNELKNWSEKWQQRDKYSRQVGKHTSVYQTIHAVPALSSRVMDKM